MMRKNKTNTLLWISLFSAILLALLWQFFPLEDAKKRFDSLPLEKDLYKGRKLPLKDWEKRYFSKNLLLKRMYEIDGKNYFITAIDGTNNRHIVHDPYFCFRGGGWSYYDQKTIDVPGGQIAHLKIRKKDLEKEALFWFSDGKKKYISPMTYWKDATLRRITLGYSGQEPVLIMVQPVGHKTIDVEALKQKFPELFSL